MVPELTHGQSFIVSWRARTAPSLTTVQSLAITVDTSPPVIKYLSDFGVGSAEVDVVGHTAFEFEVLFDTYDSESGVERTRWWIGSFPGADDVLEPQDVDYRLRAAAASVAGLIDGATYYASMLVDNGAGNFALLSSDGVRVDVRRARSYTASARCSI